MASNKQRNHNEWFQPLAKRPKRCPECNALVLYVERVTPVRSGSYGVPGTDSYGEWTHESETVYEPGLYAWGEYVNAKWRTVKHFCRQCFPKIAKQLVKHAGGCGCTITLMARSGYSIPGWISLDNCPLNENQPETYHDEINGEYGTYPK